jgi:hypothetical protein
MWRDPARPSEGGLSSFLGVLFGASLIAIIVMIVEAGNFGHRGVIAMAEN